MVTFLVILLACLPVSQLIARWKNSRETRKVEGAIKRLAGRCSFPILMPVYSRPHYLKRVLDGLAEVDGISETLLIISQDGNNREVSDLISRIDFTDKIILRHSRPFFGALSFFWDSLHAVSTNIHWMLDFTFERTGAKAAIVLEDDIVPSVDFLNYFNWVRTHVLDRDEVMTVTAFNLNSRISVERGFDPRNHPCDLVRNMEDGNEKFTGWSWAISRSKWPLIKKQWSFLSWDIGLNRIQLGLGLVSYKPVLARAKNIGMQGGINFTELEDNPKWDGVHIAQDPIAYSRAPRLLGEEPVVFSLPELSGGPANERTRTRRNRLMLGAAVAALFLLEICLLRTWFPS